MELTRGQTQACSQTQRVTLASRNQVLRLMSAVAYFCLYLA